MRVLCVAAMLAVACVALGAKGDGDGQGYQRGRVEAAAGVAGAVGGDEAMKAGFNGAVVNESNRPFALIVRNLAADGVREPEPIAMPTPAKAPPTPEPGPVFAVAEEDCPFGPSATHPDPYCPDWRPFIAQYGDWDQGEALAVLMCESSGDANAVSYAGAIGGFQIQPNGSRDPATNVGQAHAKWLYGVSYGNRWGEWNRWGSCGGF